MDEFNENQEYAPLEENKDSATQQDTGTQAAPTYQAPQAQGAPQYQAPQYQTPQAQNTPQYQPPQYQTPHAQNAPQYQPPQYQTSQAQNAPQYQPPQYQTPQAQNAPQYQPPQYQTPQAQNPPQYQPPQYQTPQAQNAPNYQPPQYRTPQAQTPPQYRPQPTEPQQDIQLGDTQELVKPQPTSQPPVSEPTSQVEPPVEKPLEQPYMPQAAPPVIPQPSEQNYYQNPNFAQQSYPYTEQNPYAQQPQNFSQYQQTPKKKMATGTKVLISILSAFLALFFIGLVICCALLISRTDRNNTDFDNPLISDSTEPFEDYYNIDPYGQYGQSYDTENFDEDIVLQEDKGETQIKDSDKNDNSASPDKSAKGISLVALPKNAQNGDYTSQTAYNTVADSVVSIVCYKDKITDEASDIVSQGSGIVMSADGYIVTNSHLIGDSKRFSIQITFNNSKKYVAKVVGYDTRTDLAVLKVDAKGLKSAVFGDSSLLKVGQDIVAIGNPGGASFQNSLTKGIVSAVDRELTLNKNVRYIQIDAAINPGNSGGPLCNIYGQIVGVNTAKITSTEYEGMGFAIPSATVKEIANDLINHGYVQGRVRIGLSGTEVTQEDVDYYSVPFGIIVSEIDPDGPLADTDIEQGDIITAVDGEQVKTFQDIYAILAKHKAGDKVKISVCRLED